MVLTRGSVEHKPTVPYAYPIASDTLRVIVRAKRGEVRECKVLYGDRYAKAGTETAITLSRVATDADFEYFQADLRLTPPRFRYAFLFADGVHSQWLSESGFSPTRPRTGFFQYPYINERDRFDVPDWLIDGVVYQVFPERFSNGDRTNDPPQVKLWTDERPTPASFYGGDLLGIVEKLLHLAELGVTVLYLNPLFTSPTHHKYDTTDYYSVDPQFGDLAMLQRLVRQCHAMGIRVILDAVFNHCGYDFFAFQDVLQHGERSRYANWFHIHSFPVKTEPAPSYETFANGIVSMPKLRTDNPEVRRYLLDVARYWIETCDIDGWRIDVANEVDHAFWQDFRRMVKEAKPEAYIVGEIWHEALPWLMGDQFDGVTNYPVRDACLDFFAHDTIDARAFSEAISRNVMAYPERMLQASWNLLGSHDTERFMTACGSDVQKVSLAVVFYMTWIGTPMVYYGDEIGMEGENDPDCRRPMIWDRARWQLDLFELHKRLIRLRLHNEALRRGAARILSADPAANTLVYWRGDEAKGAVIALNNSAREQDVVVEAPQPLSTWNELVGRSELVPSAGGVIILRLGPYAAVVGEV